MKRKHSYSLAPIERLDVGRLAEAVDKRCVAAIDVAREKMVVGFGPAGPEGATSTLAVFRHPAQTPIFLSLVAELRSREVEVTVVMEPTGTYGDVLRYQCEKLGAAVCSVSCKGVHDAAEIFDGVPSLHDAKSAVLIARLHALGRSTAWPVHSDTQRAVRALLDLRRALEVSQEQQYGMMEALLARHWPELAEWMTPRSHKSTLVLLEELGSAVTVAADPQAAAKLLLRASHGALAPELIEGAIASATRTLGVPMIEEERELVRALAHQLVTTRAHVERLDERLRALLTEGSAGAHMARIVGPYAAAVMTAMADPLRHTSAGALEKACGLNLREKSSGAEQGRLHLTKRGPSLVRKALFLAALRLIYRDPYVRAWYEKRKAYALDQRMKAVVAVMRKLVRALFHVARGSVFDVTKLFDTRRLTPAVPSPQTEMMPPKRTERRSTIQTQRRAQRAERSTAQTS